MNYQKIYNSIIELSQNRKISGYTEKHHIIPKCIGGSNDSDNIAILSAREHFICHYILTKFIDNDKIILAFNMMRSNKTENRYMNSRLFESVKIKYSKVISKIHKNKTVSQETRDKISNNKERRDKISKALKGKPRTPEAIKSHVDSRRKNGTYNYSDETKKIWSEHRKGSGNGMYGKTHTEEARLKISEANKKQVICPHCGKQGAVSIMKRWHFDKCKHKII